MEQLYVSSYILYNISLKYDRFEAWGPCMVGIAQWKSAPGLIPNIYRQPLKESPSHTENATPTAKLWKN